MIVAARSYGMSVEVHQNTGRAKFFHISGQPSLPVSLSGVLNVNIFVCVL